MKQFFTESGNGQSSMTRLIFFVGMLYAMVFTAFYTFTFKPGTGEVIALFTAMTGVFIGLKLGQKPMEEKSNNIKTNGTNENG
jgi:hypothetical protein